MTVILNFWCLRFCFKILRHFVEKLENSVLYANLQNNQKNMNNYQFLVIFIQKIKSLTAKSNFHNFLHMWCHQC